MIPLIVNTPDPMLRVRVVTTTDRTDSVLKTLHKIGSLHIEESTELKPIDRKAIDQERGEISDLLGGIDDVLAYIPAGERVSLDQDVEVIYSRPFTEVNSDIRLLCTKLIKMHHQYYKIEGEVTDLANLKKRLYALNQPKDTKLEDLSFSGSYLFSAVFAIPGELYETMYARIKNFAFEVVKAPIDNEITFYLIARTKHKEYIENAAREAGGQAVEIPDENTTVGEFFETVEDKIQILREESSKIYHEIVDKTRDNLKELALFREALLAESEKLSVLEKACAAKYVTLTEGWIPKDKRDETISEVRQNVEYVFIDTRKPEPAEEPPTRMRNAREIKPFQVIVNLFAVPKYREWDPTPVVAFSFAFFFGLMLGDVVYALIIMLFAYKGLYLFVDDPDSEGVKLFQRILYISSGVALVIGFLTGSYMGDFYAFFGIESLALVESVRQTLNNPMSFIVLSLIIGLVHVNTGHVLALIAGIKKKERATMLNKAGLFILQLAGLPWIIHSMLGIDIPLLTAPMYSALLYTVGLGIVLIIASSIVQKGAFLGSIFWLFDITGILGDIMSYCRLAGVGLATFYLASCFNMIAGLIYEMMPTGIVRIIGGGLLAVIILMIGHMINLVLSGITCFVHSLRLCFVEFLFKFYEGGGREYSPFCLKHRPVFVKGKA
jgi:V/A-type H+/Na+-transporting ATPase subunit I